MNKKHNIVAIIPARGGSKGIPRKNIKLLCGKPLIAYSIQAALESRLIQRIIVSTEDKEILKIATEYKAEVIKRPLKLALDSTPSLPVFQHVIKHLEEKENYIADIIVILQPTSPLRIAADIDDAVQKFLNIKCDSVVSVCETEHPPHWMYTLQHDKLKPLIKEGERILRRQDAPKIYRLNGAIYVTDKNTVMDQKSVMGNDIRGYIMPSDRSVDIDTQIDFDLAEVLIRQRILSGKNQIEQSPFV
jgi:CMP-N,N'-diacetyllegionaminic acid synthase